MPMKPKDMIKLLKQNGFEEISSNGSHRKLYNPKSKKTVIVPYHSTELKTGLKMQY